MRSMYTILISSHKIFEGRGITEIEVQNGTYPPHIGPGDLCVASPARLPLPPRTGKNPKHPYTCTCTVQRRSARILASRLFSTQA